MKKKLAGLLTFVMILSLFTLTSIAEPMQYSEKPTIGTESSDPNFTSGFQMKSTLTKDKSSDGQAVDSYTAAADSDHAEILMWKYSFYKRSSTSFYASATTYADEPADRIAHLIELLRWNGYYWESYSMDYDVGFDIDYFFSETDFNVEKGYYYMITVGHSLSDNGYNEYQHSNSDYLYAG